MGQRMNRMNQMNQQRPQGMGQNTGIMGGRQQMNTQGGDASWDRSRDVRSQGMGQNTGFTGGGQQMNMSSQSYQPYNMGGAGSNEGGRTRDSSTGDYYDATGGGNGNGSASNGRGLGILEQWQGRPGSDKGTKNWTNPDYYANEGNRNTMEGYSSLYAVPMFNAALAQQTQDYNQFSDARNFGEQQYLNRGQMGLAERGASREDLALQYGQGNWEQGFGLEQELGRGAQAIDRDRLNMESGLGYGRLGLDRDMGMGRLNLDREMGRGDLNLRGELGRGELANTRFANEAQAARYAGMTSNEAFANQSQDARFRGMTENEAAANAAQAERFRGMTGNEAAANAAQAERYRAMSGNEQFANQTGRMGEENKLFLGKGDLDLRGRDLDLTNAYRNNQLAQEAQLSREKFKNELQNTRLAATGRIAGQNARAVRSWY